MFEDRHIESARGLPMARGSISVLLILLNLLVFVGQNAASQLQSLGIYSDFALSINGLRHGEFWQLLTFQFLHLPVPDGGFFHLMGNLFVIYIFGPTVETAIGKSNFLNLYLLSGVMGGLLQMTGGLFWPAQFGHAVIGASAGAFGLIAAFAALFPRRKLHFFFLPVELRARAVFLLGILVTVACLFLSAPHAGVAHCAHLGGMLTGFFFISWIRRHVRRSSILPTTAKSALEITPALD